MFKNLVYFGSPDFSAEILQSILDLKLVNVVGVVTPADKPMGRKQILTRSPVALLAEKYNLPTYKPTKLDESNLAHLKLLKPDIFLVVSYGKMIPKSWLDLPLLGTFNIHFSLLPKYRGALCISEAIKNQDIETGVTFMEMDEGMDHGAIIKQKMVNIDIDDNVADLTTKLTQAAKEILIHNLPEICAENYQKTPQDESLATFTKSHKTLNRESSYIPWDKIQFCLDDSSLRVQTRQDETTPAVKSQNSAALHALIRSLNPEPGAWTNVSAVDLKILRTQLANNCLEIKEVQMSGKNPISWKQFLSGHKI